MSQEDDYDETHNKGEMLVDFPTGQRTQTTSASNPPKKEFDPTKAPSSAGGPRRHSHTMQPASGLGGLVDFDDDSDFDDDEDDQPISGSTTSGSRNGDKSLPGAPMGTGTASATAMGGPNHRPLVGGFAAAAYEAAREYHYHHNPANKTVVKRNGPPPSI